LQNLAFETERLVVETVIDAASISSDMVIEILSDSTTKYLPPDWQCLSTDRQIVEWITHRLKDGLMCTVCLRSLKQTAGFLFVYGLVEQEDDNSVRIGYVISEQFWGRGIASELVEGLLNACRNIGNIATVIGGVDSDNIGSKKVLIKNGFTLSSCENSMEYYENRLSL
jgi:[ribosomal protein S5]-alanine N-acetyltransferase